MSAPTECLRCGYAFDQEERLNGPRDLEPVEGDVHICVQCGAIAVFTGSGREVRWPTEAERLDILQDAEVVELAVKIETARQAALDEGRRQRRRQAHWRMN